MSRTVIQAAAGCGKTTRLACAYLELVKQGHRVEQMIAITFTRRAAAELVERVGLALRAAAGDDTARAALGSAASTYLEAGPDDPAVAREALEHLGSAPIGTTDHFVAELLAEFALHAELPLPNGQALPLDIGMLAVPDLTAHLDAAARALIDPPESPPPYEVEILAPYFSLAEIHALITRSSDLEALPVASCAEVLDWLARQMAEAWSTLDLEVALKVGEGGWEAAVAKVGLKGTEWTHATVAQWLEAGADPTLAPRELVSWRLHRSWARPLVDRLEETVFDFGIATVRMQDILTALKHPYSDPEHLRTADVLRESVERLRVQVASDALEQAALHGELSHAHATRCAARLASSPVLAHRFTALLVDEIQDANPDQLALYQALAAQRGMSSVFVGDTRQSIYLFRGGEPRGLAELAATADVQHALVNFRSTPELVRAHRVLFGALKQPLERARLDPLEPLDDLEPDPERAADSLDPSIHARPEPVHVVYDPSGRRNVYQANDEAVRQFWLRLQDAWREPGHDGDTAAVLCPTWRDAREARDLLRQLAGDDRTAWLEGGDHWLSAGVGRDVLSWLTALSDPNDDIAWLAVLKHPSVGLTDGALARMRATDRRALGHRVRKPLEEGHDPRDVFAFERARAPLQQALDRIGRDDTSAVLDALFTALQWRAVLQASPGGADDVARLDVILDWIGDADANGHGVDSVIALLRDGADVPRVRLEREGRAITCTTLFQAKGLAWDHVVVLSPGRAGRLEPDPDADLWIRLDGERKRLVGLRFDPEGGLLPYQDPLRRLAVGILKARYAEEGARLAYVGVTRARRSVTIGLPDRGQRMSQAQQIVCDTWRSIEHPTIAVVPPPPEQERQALQETVVHPTGPFPVLDRRPFFAFTDLPPSAAAARYSTEAKEAVAAHLATRVALAGGRLDGGEDVPPPVDDHPHFTPADWGDVAHGWFAAWRFDGPATDERIARWLVEECGSDDLSVRAWLLRLSTRLVERAGPAWALVTAKDARLHFEVPVIGLGGPDEDLFLAGRPDLVVVRGTRAAIVDFKAGWRSPRPGSDLVESAGLKTYGPQLEAYREVLERNGFRVERTLLWFVRTGGVVQW